MPERMTALHRIRLGPQAVSEALAAVRAFVAATALGDCALLAIIVEELICNLVDYGERPGDIVELEMAAEDDGVRVRLSDGCLPFDPRADRRDDLPPDRGGGAGLAMVRAWSTIEAYERIGGYNTLRLLIGYERLR